ncbi:MAG: hypothetical protein ACI9Y1_000135 [Lentisphaeria bacterium]
MRWLAACILLCAQWTYAGLPFFKDEGLDIVVVDPFVEMHTGPGRGYPKFHVIEKGQQVHIFKRFTNWFKVSTKDGIKGWIKRSDLTKTLGPEGQKIDFSAPNRQDYLDSRWELGVLGGTFETADAFTTYIGFNLTQNISTELRYTETFSATATNKLFSLNAIHKPFPSWLISPFFTLGAGRILISPSSDLVQTEERRNSTLTVGGGVLIYVSRRFLVRMEFNNHTLLTQREQNEEVDEWKIGFSVFF